METRETTVFIAEWTTLETTLEIDRGSPSFIVMTVDVVGLQSVHMCNQGGVMLPLGADEEANNEEANNSRIVFIGRNLPAGSVLRMQGRGQG